MSHGPTDHDIPMDVSQRSSLFQTISELLFNHKHSNSSTSSANMGPRLFALIVAIDKYKSAENQDLLGCKLDGERFKEFLTGMLGVPPSQIIFLADENATREAMLSQFQQHFIDNTNIMQGDGMIFFYAGHGSRNDAPAGWVSEGNKIEAICPHDEKTLGPDGKEIHAIPDRTIDGLMRTLASRKGDNIIAIFDCCHSGGASRSDEVSSLRARSTPASPHPPPSDLDREIWDFSLETSPRGTKSAVAIGSYKAMESHVLLAACRPDESAWGDHRSGGLFTNALLKALRRCLLHDTTYSQLIEQLRVEQGSQHPQCLGANKDRLLFSVNTIQSGETTFKVSQREGDLWASAGSIHGIVVGTEFTVKSGTQSIVLKSVEVGAFECLLERDHSFNSTAYPACAVVSNWNHPKLTVHSPLHHSSPHFTVVPADKSPDVVVHQNGSRWEIERLDLLIPTYSSPRISVEADAKEMDGVLNLIAIFNSYLYRPDKAGGTFAGEIKVQLNRVEGSGNAVYPTGDDLLVDVPSSSSAGMEVKEATITITDLNCDDEYCVTLENFTDVDLYPYIFYFDPSDYSIQKWYLPPSPTMPPPLGRRKEDGTPSLFAYGYGGFGTDPFQLCLPDDRTTDSGFLKIFLTNAYVDMNHVVQSSINKMRIHHMGSKSQKPTHKGIWECRTFVLTCKASGTVSGEGA